MHSRGSSLRSRERPSVAGAGGSAADRATGRGRRLEPVPVGFPQHDRVAHADDAVIQDDAEGATAPGRSHGPLESG